MRADNSGNYNDSGSGDQEPRFLHRHFTLISKLATQSTNSNVFKGTISSTEGYTTRDLSFLGEAKKVILKQYKLKKDKKAFKKELKILKKIKSLDI